MMCLRVMLLLLAAAVAGAVEGEVAQGLELGSGWRGTAGRCAGDLGVFRPARTPTLLIQRVTRQDLGSAGVSGAVSWGFARAWLLRLSAVRNWRRQSHH